MATDQRPSAVANRPICHAGALLAVMLVSFADVRAEDALSRAPATAFVPGILDQRPVDLAPTTARAKKESSLRGNPLWAVPLAALSETRARPVFSPSRRPPPPTPVAAAPSPPAPPPPAAKEPDQPQLTLLGTVIGQAEAIGIFLDKTSQGVIRLKRGEHHLGWILLSVHRGAASLEKNHAETTLTLPRPGADQPSVAPDAGKPMPAGLCGSGGGRPDRCASPAVSTAPAVTPATGNAHKARRDI